MVLDRETVKNCLRESHANYEAELLAINLIPKDELLEVDIEEDIVALYFNSEGERTEFHLDYAYLKCSANYDNNERELGKEINKSLQEERDEVDKHSKLLKEELGVRIATSMLVVSIVGLVVYMMTL